MNGIFLIYNLWERQTRLPCDDRRSTERQTLRFLKSFLMFILVLNGCGKVHRPQSITAARTIRTPITVESSIAQIETATSFELYSTLASKMARMEELLNAIDRLLGEPDFQDRLLADAKEFHQLLSESRGLYPEKLAPEDQQKFDQSIDRTAAVAKKLLHSIQANNNQAAREVLSQLGKQRRKAHTRFSY